MNPQTWPNVRPLLCLLAAGVLGWTTANAWAVPPAAVAALYADKLDATVSDEFDSGSKPEEADLSKWKYREPVPDRPGLGTGVQFVFEKDGILNCMGLFDQKKAGQIISLNPVKYGFVEAKFRTVNFSTNKASPFHPAIWFAKSNGKSTVKTNHGNWLEIDFIEFSNNKRFSWGSHCPPFFNGQKWKNPRAIMVEQNKFGIGEWQTYGLEYNPDYIQVWEQTDGGWKKIGAVLFHDGDTINATTLPKAVRTDGYWYLGNLYFNKFGGGAPSETQNTDFQIDYFRFFPLK